MARYPDFLIQYVNGCGNRVLAQPVRPGNVPKFVTASLLCRTMDLRIRVLRRMHHLSEKLAAQITPFDDEQHMAFVADTAAMET